MDDAPLRGAIWHEASTPEEKLLSAIFATKDESESGRTQEADIERPPAYISTMTREEMDAKLQATEARMEATEHRIGASLTRMESRLSHLPSTLAMAGTAASAAVATIGIIIGVMAFGGDRFDGGVQVSSASVQAANDALSLGKQNSEHIKTLATRADQFQAQWTGEVNRLIDAINGREPIAPTKPQ